MFKLNDYADIKKLLNDQIYADSKHLIVNRFETMSCRVSELEDSMREIGSDDKDWRTKVNILKREIVDEKIRCARYVIKYDKKYITLDNAHTLGLFRSVICDGVGNIICFSPPKSISIKRFKENTVLGDCEVLEFSEGTMVNMYYDTIEGGWELATRSNIGARCKFYKDTPNDFRRMFLEAFTRLSLGFSDFNAKYCYSFVLQHPDNQIVVPYEQANIIHTNTYECTGAIVRERVLHIKPALLPFVKEYNVENPSEDIDDIIQGISSGIGIDYLLQGIVVCDRITGLRYKVRNPNYDYVKRLKGNDTDKQFNYYRLRKTGDVSEYLRYFPQDVAIFKDFKTQLHNWTKTLWTNYVNCFIKKENKHASFAYEYKPHMYALQGIYQNEFRNRGKKLSYNTVIDYVNELPPARVMFSVNYKRIDCSRVNTDADTGVDTGVDVTPIECW